MPHALPRTCTDEGRPFHSLQLLRALAAIGVVWAHAVNQELLRSGQSLIHHVGIAGVDVFFVLSGFIITRTALASASGTAFFIRRWRRVVPLYWILSIPWLLIAFATRPDWPAALTMTLTFWPLQGYPLLEAGWTLCFEMLFYAAVALIVGRGWKAWVGLGAFALALQLARPVVGGPVLDALGAPILMEFLFGAAIAWFWRRPRPRLGILALVAGVIALMALGPPDVDERGWDRVLTLGLPAFAVVWGALQLERPWMARWTLLGDASYSIYLIHMLVLFALAAVWRPDFPPSLFAVAGILLSIIAGLVTYRRIERPLLGKWIPAASPPRLPYSSPQES